MLLEPLSEEPPDELLLSLPELLELELDSPELSLPNRLVTRCATSETARRIGDGRSAAAAAAGRAAEERDGVERRALLFFAPPFELAPRAATLLRDFAADFPPRDAAAFDGARRALLRDFEEDFELPPRAFAEDFALPRDALLRDFVEDFLLPPRAAFEEDFFDPPRAFEEDFDDLDDFADDFFDDPPRDLLLLFFDDDFLLLLERDFDEPLEEPLEEDDEPLLRFFDGIDDRSFPTFRFRPLAIEKRFYSHAFDLLSDVDAFSASKCAAAITLSLPMNESSQSREPSPRVQSNMRAAWPLILVTLTAAALFTVARGVILDPIIDVGRDFYVARRLAAGARLYRDLHYNYPPLAPYALSLVVRALGASLAVFTTFNFVVALVTTFSLYDVTRIAFNRAAATVAAMLFVTLSLAGATTWNSSFIMPYAVAASLGMMFVLLFADALVRFVPHPAALRASCVVAAGTLAAWSKQEYAIVVVATLLIGAVVHRSMRRTAVLFALLNAALFALAAFYFGDPRPGYHWIGDNIFNPALTRSAAASAFYGAVRGSGAALGRNIALMIVSASLCAALLYLLAKLDRTERSAKRLGLLLVVAVAELALAPILFRGMPIVLIAGAILLLRRDRQSPALLLLVVALTSLIRIFFAASPAWYGFALAVPCYIALAGLFLHEGRSRRLYNRATSLLSLPLFAFAALLGLTQQLFVYSSAEVVVHTARGDFLDPIDDRAMVLNDLMRWCESSGAKSMVVFPEGVSLNYFTGIDTPLSYYLFTPIESAGQEVQTRILSELTRRPPDLIVLVSRDVSEFGSQGFGVDYDMRMMKFVRENYSVAHAAERTAYGGVIFKRNSAAR